MRSIFAALAWIIVSIKSELCKTLDATPMIWKSLQVARILSMVSRSGRKSQFDGT